MNRLAKCVLRTDYATYAVSNNENPRREYQHYGSSAFYRTEAFPFGTTGKIGAGQPAEDHRLRIEGRNSPYNEASARVMPKQTTARPPMFSVALACPPKLTIVYVEVPSNRIEPNIGSDSDKGGAKSKRERLRDKVHGPHNICGMLQVCSCSFRRQHRSFSGHSSKCLRSVSNIQ